MAKVPSRSLDIEYFCTKRGLATENGLFVTIAEGVTFYPVFYEELVLDCCAVWDSWRNRKLFDSICAAYVAIDKLREPKWVFWSQSTIANEWTMAIPPNLPSCYEMNLFTSLFTVMDASPTCRVCNTLPTLVYLISKHVTWCFSFSFASHERKSNNTHPSSYVWN